MTTTRRAPAKADNVDAVSPKETEPLEQPDATPPRRKGGWKVEPNGLWAWVDPEAPPPDTRRRSYTKPTGARAKAIAKNHSKAMKDYHRRRREEELAAGIVKAPRIQSSKPNRSKAALARAAAFDRERGKDPDRKMQMRAAAARYREANREKLRQAAVDRRAGVKAECSVVETIDHLSASHVFALTADLVFVLKLLAEDEDDMKAAPKQPRTTPLIAASRAHCDCAKLRRCTRRGGGLQCMNLRLPRPLSTRLTARGRYVVRISKFGISPVALDDWLSSLGPYGRPPRRP